ncbi:ATP-binding protein [Azomonas macrocytogenes]|nr:ATP-binding protein [Azomonas macrocytogenes]
MKLQMKLRTRLFLGFSALMTVALLGLGLGLVSVVQMARSQEILIKDSFGTIEVNQQLRQVLERHLALLIKDDRNLDTLQTTRQAFFDTLARGLDEAIDEEECHSYQAIADAYSAFNYQLDLPRPANWSLGLDDQLTNSLQEVRNLMNDMQGQAYARVRHTETAAREKALMLAGILTLIGIAILLIGFITAHGFARRFSSPIEKLSRAADQIGKGDFNIKLPRSPIAELSSLSTRFGLMAHALNQFQQTNVEALVNGQQRLQALLDSIDDGLLIIDREGCLEHANPVAQRQLAWDNEYIGQALGQALGDPALNDAAQQVLNDQPLNQPPQDLDIEADGERRLLAWRLSPVSHHDGRISGAVMVLHDVTDQRNFERVRNEFVLRASHELRTPVTGIQMAFSLLREKLKFPQNSRESDLLITVHDELHRLVQQINDLLDFSRYQSGQQKLQPILCEVSALLEKASQRHQAQAAQCNINLSLDIEPELPGLMLDTAQMERVLDNLLSNALRHTPSGGLVRLQARRHGDRVIVSVEDNGEGIPYNQQARIFEPFVQIGRHHGGAGLGLALCKEIVQLHGGRIGVHSRIGHGTIFYLSMPV